MKLFKFKGKKKDENKLPLGRALGNNIYMLRKIAKLAPAYIVFTIALGVFNGAANSLTTILSYKLFNELDNPDVTFWGAAVYIVLILAFNAALYIFYAAYFQRIQPEIDKKLHFRMHEELFRHAEKMDLSCFDDPKFYNDYVWAMDESKARAKQILDDTGEVIQYVFTLTTLITLMMSIDVAVGVILVVGAVLNMVLERVWDKLIFKRNEKTKPYHRKKSYVNRVYHLADYAKELRISDADDNLQTTYTDSVSHIIEEEVAAGKKIYVITVLQTVLSYVLQYGPMAILLYRLYGGTSQLGGFVASLDVIWSIQWSMYDLGQKLMKLPDNAQYVEKYKKFLAYEPKIVGGEVRATPLETLEFRNVTFSYPGGGDSKSLDRVSFGINKGEKVAIVGYNGAGKTTLTKLAMRLYDPTDGEILYNGRDLRDYDIPSLRNRIGAVFQDYKIFAATVAENVLCRECGRDDRDTVTGALEKATFGDKLAALEGGIDTQLTKEFYDSGINLSGGESQKVAIARIFARPYDLMIMDEPSSALDPSAEYELNHTILDHTRDRTVIFISHRLSTTRMADRILMFAGGNLIEEGSHDELMEMGGKYAEMFRLQAEKYREA